MSSTSTARSKPSHEPSPTISPARSMSKSPSQTSKAVPQFHSSRKSSSHSRPHHVTTAHRRPSENEPLNKDTSTQILQPGTASSTVPRCSPSTPSALLDEDEDPPHNHKRRPSRHHSSSQRVSAPLSQQETLPASSQVSTRQAAPDVRHPQGNVFNFYGPVNVHGPHGPCFSFDSHEGISVVPISYSQSRSQVPTHTTSSSSHHVLNNQNRYCSGAIFNFFGPADVHSSAFGGLSLQIGPAPVRSDTTRSHDPQSRRQTKESSSYRLSSPLTPPPRKRKRPEESRQSSSRHSQVIRVDKGQTYNYHYYR